MALIRPPHCASLQALQRPCNKSHLSAIVNTYPMLFSSNRLFHSRTVDCRYIYTISRLIPCFASPPLATTRQRNDQTAAPPPSDPPSARRGPPTPTAASRSPAPTARGRTLPCDRGNPNDPSISNGTHRNSHPESVPRPSAPAPAPRRARAGAARDGGFTPVYTPTPYTVHGGVRARSAPWRHACEATLHDQSETHTW